MREEKGWLSFTTDDGEEIEFEVLAETKLVGINYLLVSPEDTEDEVLIFKNVSMDDDEYVYEILEDEKEMEILINIFKELIDDIEIH